MPRCAFPSRRDRKTGRPWRDLTNPPFFAASKAFGGTGHRETESGQLSSDIAMRIF